MSLELSGVFSLRLVVLFVRHAGGELAVLRNPER